MTVDPEDTVITAACAGDPAARRSLAGWLLAAARAMASIRLYRVRVDRPEIDDLVQQAVTDALAALPEIRHKTALGLRALTSRIVERRVVDLIRKERVRRTARQLPIEALDSMMAGGGALFGSLASQHTPSSHVRLRDVVVRLLTLVDALPAKDRELLVLLFWDGLRTAEAAERLGRGRTAVANHAHRVVNALRAAWKRRYGEP